MYLLPDMHVSVWKILYLYLYLVILWLIFVCPFKYVLYVFVFMKRCRQKRNQMANDGYDFRPYFYADAETETIATMSLEITPDK